MKILMVIDSLAKGGKERRMLEVIKELKKDGEKFDIHLVSLSEKVEYQYVYDLPIQLTVFKRKFKKDPSAFFLLRKIINGFKPDIIHSWGTMASIYLVPLLLFRKIPLVNGVIADAPQHVDFSNKIYQRVRLTSPFSAVFVSNSKAGLIAYRIPAKKSVCIYNGIDFNRFLNLAPPAQVEKEFWPQGKNGRFIIAMVAAFEKRKDYHTLIQAAISLCTASSQVVFMLIGDGQDLPAIKNELPAGLAGTRIFFTGKRNDIESLLQITDVGVLLTNSDVHGEGISNSIIEYMASGKPVIATRGGGTDEVVQDHVNGFLIDPKNPQQLLERLKLLLGDPGLCRKLGDAGYTFVHENFDAIKAKQKYEDLYRRLIG